MVGRFRNRRIKDLRVRLGSNRPTKHSRCSNDVEMLLRVLFVLHFIHFLRSILIKLLQNMCSLSYRFKKR